jgi:hypothetical protein
LDHAREQIHQIQSAAFAALGLAPNESHEEPHDAEERERLIAYLRTNPDNDEALIAKTLTEWDAQATLPNDVLDPSGSPRSSILSRRVSELKRVFTDLGVTETLAAVCYGTVPGGGLDAFSFKVSDRAAYGVVIPEGFFHFVNLWTKIVILLQPFTPTKDGPVYMPTASFAQFGLVDHPYIRFRHRDLLEAFFRWGNPLAALPYFHALSYQDRFAYLLVGTELFVIAHEIAHVLLGHLDAGQPATPESEGDADELALKIVTQYFRREGTNYPSARATLCGTLFLSMTRAWETGLTNISKNETAGSWHTHPAFVERIQRFGKALETLSDKETPSWYIFIHNAIRIATEQMTTAAEAEMAQQDCGLESLSARVLPSSYAHLGHLNQFSRETYTITIAKLLTSGNPAEYRLGLWFLREGEPEPILGLYQGLLSEDPDTQAICERALMRLEPLYQSYIPRLRERFRETKRADEFEAYLLHLAAYLGAKVHYALKPERYEDGPMTPGFFDDQDQSGVGDADLATPTSSASDHVPERSKNWLRALPFVGKGTAKRNG